MKNRKNIAIFAIVAAVTITIVALALNRTNRTASGNDHSDHSESGHDGKKDAHGEAGHGESEGLIDLSDDQIAAAGIATDTVKSGSLRTEIALPAEVKLNADNVAHIFPRFSGVVKQVQKSVGDRVKKGEVLATIESNESLNNYQIRSLIDGTIIERHIALGEMIRDDAECFVVADISTVWIDISVYPRDLPKVREGSAVRVVASNMGVEAEGSVTYLNPVVSEHTRTALARVKMPNPDNKWRPGTFVTAYVTSASVDVPLAIQREAIQTIGGKPTVFVETDSGAFRAQTVEIGRTTSREVEVMSGLSLGTTYVTKGSFVLKAELGKSEAGHSHD